ncbi:hypothetical protein O3M35_007592 [Rhynocoris fuscipes]|uniref:Uncharacterized protein n=1 Tax=Rhynocoris fuscipes TaxID=488301 RepID=A0AAW1DCK1_9HEMI
MFTFSFYCITLKCYNYVFIKVQLYVLYICFVYGFKFCILSRIVFVHYFGSLIRY